MIVKWVNHGIAPGSRNDSAHGTDFSPAATTVSQKVVQNVVTYFRGRTAASLSTPRFELDPVEFFLLRRLDVGLLWVSFSFAAPGVQI